MICATLRDMAHPLHLPTTVFGGIATACFSTQLGPQQIPFSLDNEKDHLLHAPGVNRKDERRPD